MQGAWKGKRVGFIFVAALLTGAIGCRHKQSKITPQQLPPNELTYSAGQPASPKTQQQTAAGATLPPARIPETVLPPGGVSADDLRYVTTHKPILSEVGYASWYTAPYKGRKAANGQVFDDTAMTAAHRTLPMGSLIVVTNIETRQRATMRVSDRGPFVEGRIVDLTIASAKATGIYIPGTARVRVDVYQTPKPIETGGRWCVQIGAFHSESEAIRLKNQLARRYEGANVIEFPGEKSYWVRIRPQGDDREMAELIASRLHPAEGKAFLTRLD
jgi:rare lipoprotein A